jgi:hypothetical protein
MAKFKLGILSIIGCLALTFQIPAQIVTNEYPLTALETLELTSGQLVVKGTAPVGYVSIGSWSVTVTSQEDSVVGLNRKEYGIQLETRSGSQLIDKTVVDYAELDALLRAVDYVSKVDWSVTTLSSFDVGYTTRAGFRVAAFSSKRTGKIQFTLRGNRLPKGIQLTPDQLYQFYTILAQAKANLDTLRAPAQ